MRRAALAVAAAAYLLAGCGSGAHGRATVWVTRDEGRTLLVDRQVPAGESALQALDRVAKVGTRYGGRFVQSVNGLSGSVASRHDWFYFVNGIEGSHGAQEYRVRDGDVVWWDYRDWGRVGETVPAAVGAFPEPFLHGFGGRVPPALVVGPRTAAVDRVVRLLHGRRARRVATGANVLVIRPGGATSFTARTHPGGVVFTFRGDPRLLLSRGAYAHRYRLP